MSKQSGPNDKINGLEKSVKEEPGEGDEDEPCLYPKWRNAPRSPADFKESKTSISSCRDSDYERWLADYYMQLVFNQMPTSGDKQIGTSELDFEPPTEYAEPLFRPVKKDQWTEGTKYWGPQNIRRHWALRKAPNDYVFVPSIQPDLDLRSRYGRFHSQLYTAAAVPEAGHRVFVCSLFKRVVLNLVVNKTKIAKMLYCDNLYNMKWMDYLTKIALMRFLCRFIKSQHSLEKVYLENACLQRKEGIVILCALSRSSGDRIKELHMWKMFAYGQCPLLINELPERDITRESKSQQMFTTIHYLQVLYKFSCLTRLSINYAYLAGPTGDALLCIKSLRSGTLKELRILCLRDERPGRTNPSYGVGGCVIGDEIWKRAVDLSPDLTVKFVFLNMPQYENIILFLSKSIPMSYVYISSGIDLTFECPWDIDSTLLELRNWYSNTLETLCLHLWHHRDLLDIVIKDKILKEFPMLVKFEFIGVLEDVDTLNKFCCQLSTGNYKLKTLLFWVQEQHTDKKKLTRTRTEVERIRQQYRKQFQTLDIDADIQTYAL